MELLDTWWASAALAAIVLSDAVMSLRPPRFIQECLDGVRFPRDWWWTLIAIKFTAVAGLVVGLWLPGIALAASAGLVVYFVAASAAHVRARFFGSGFWINCLGMSTLSIAVFAVTAAIQLPALVG